MNAIQELVERLSGHENRLIEAMLEQAVLDGHDLRSMQLKYTVHNASWEVAVADGRVYARGGRDIDGTTVTFWANKV